MTYTVRTIFRLRMFHILGALAMVFAGCDLGDRPSDDLVLDASADQKSFVYPLAQTFTLVLDLNADAGYQWFISLTDTSVVRLEGTEYHAKGGNRNACGGMTVETFVFRTAGAGMCAITLAERQGWMPNDPPLHRVQFTVYVQP